MVGYQFFTEWQNGSGETMMLLFVLVFLLLIAGLFTWFLKKMRLLIEVRTMAIWYKLPPLLYKWKSIQKEEIEKFEVREYRPILEYGGWGIKTKWRNRSIAYNIRGNIGLQLYLKMVKKYFWGLKGDKALSML